MSIYSDEELDELNARYDTVGRKKVGEAVALQRAYMKAKSQTPEYKASMKKYRQKNKEKLNAYHRKYQDANRGAINARAQLRYCTKLKATPKWANKKEIKRIYELAYFLSQILEDGYQVDHIVPLRSKLVCGLHCEANLRVIHWRDNIVKGNREWPDMP